MNPSSDTVIAESLPYQANPTSQIYFIIKQSNVGGKKREVDGRSGEDERS